nr:hypothetical protein [uncultured Mediterranean phage uvMED]
MAYIGNTPAEAFSAFQKQDFTTSATTSYTLDHPVSNQNEIALFINFVRQEPTAAYTASGTTLTLTSATSGSDDMYCVYLGKAVQTVNPPSGSVGLSQLSATGTKSSSTFLRGDNTFAAAGVTGISSSADATAITIDSGERVGINSSNMSSLDAEANQLVVGSGSGNQGLTVYSDGSSSGSIFFANGTAGTQTKQGQIVYEQNNSTMLLKTANATAMSIDGSGKVLVNGTSTSFNTKLLSEFAGGEYGMQLNSTATSGTQYHLTFTRGGTEAGYLTSTSATAVALNNSSDQRLKENIQNSNSAIQDLKDMKVRQFDWKDEIDTHKDFGFVAQELVNVVPEAVVQGSDELNENGRPVRTWGVDYSHIVPRLVKVCQEQQTKIEELEARITTLENA